ncbi:MAG: YciK family oxidoreductase [Gammaproteobacteria bacterium]|nr:YciK family oxidoreductase [Gammaproteobacteria bacterium]HJN95026.1 YciK family oxidoreductase [Gammaproteobacteria bacterium]|tara:strand:- start:163 stop:933 length:771 start_codon:yes stop_codon:yes gene_type:complete
MFDYLAPADLLEGKSILITGASDGIGRACATCFANHGATVILLGRSQGKLEAVYDEIEKQQPGKVIIHPLDFATAQADDYRVLADSLGQQIGSLDGLLHNAALLGARNPIEFYPDQDWQQLMQVNVNAAFSLTKALLPALSNSVDARLLFTSSSVGRVGRAYWGAYAVSKFAVEGLMQTLADELVNTSSIRVNSLNPGGTRTAMRRSAYPAEDPQTQPTAESLMPVYLYLLSPAAQTIHGQALNARDFDPTTVMSD